MRGLRSAALLLLVPLLGTAQVPVRDQRPAPPVGDSSITGRVMTAEGRPLGRARVMLRLTGTTPAMNTGGRASGPGLWQQTTDSTGQFTFAKLPAGTYSLSASHPQYLTAQYGQQFIGQPGRPIELAAGQTLRANLTAVRGAAITGRIFDETGEPISDVSVQAYRYAMQGTRRQLVPVGGRTYGSNDIGQYRIANLPPGDYLVAAHYRGQGDPNEREAGVRAGYAPTYYPGSVTPSAAQAVRVRPGNDAANIDFMLQPTRLVTVSGTIVTSSGEPASGSQLFVTTINDDLAMSTRVGTRVMQDGTFTVTDLTPGEYLFTAQRPVGGPGQAGGARGGAPARGSGPPAAQRREMEYGTLRVNVSGAPIDNVAIYLRPGAQIRVRVETDVPLPGGRAISLIGDERPALTQSISLSGNGEAVFHAGPGRYRVMVSGLPPGWVTERVMAGSRDITTSGLVVTDNAPVDVVVRASSQGATITGGAMTLAAPSSPADYTVVLLSEDAASRTGAGGGVRTARADQEGRFVMRGLRAGSYFVAALDYFDPNELYDPAFWARVEPNAVRITLAAGETKQVSAPFISRR